MNCPNCGAETNESVCPVCGAAVGTSGGFALAGNDQPQQPENAAYGAQPQQGMGMDPQYGGPQYQGDPMQNGYAGNAYGTPGFDNGVGYQQPPKKKKSGRKILQKVCSFRYHCFPQQNRRKELHQHEQIRKNHSR